MLNQERNKLKLDISIANSNIKELQDGQEMLLKGIEGLMSQKIEIEKENEDMEKKIHGHAMTE